MQRRSGFRKKKREIAVKRITGRFFERGETVDDELGAGLGELWRSNLGNYFCLFDFCFRRTEKNPR